MNNEYSVNTDVPARRNRRSHPRVVHPGRSPGHAAPLPGAPDPARRSAAAHSACAGLAALLLVLLVPSHHAPGTPICFPTNSIGFLGSGSACEVMVGCLALLLLAGVLRLPMVAVGCSC